MLLSNLAADIPGNWAGGSLSLQCCTDLLVGQSCPGFCFKTLLVGTIDSLSQARSRGWRGALTHCLPFPTVSLLISPPKLTQTLGDGPLPALEACNSLRGWLSTLSWLESRMPAQFPKASLFFGNTWTPCSADGLLG